MAKLGLMAIAPVGGQCSGEGGERAAIRRKILRCDTAGPTIAVSTRIRCRGLPALSRLSVSGASRR
jgi:hypothetical protein